MNYSFQDYKSRISIIQVAMELGYKFERGSGITQPAFVKSDGSGNEIDKIYIKNPHNNNIQGYWRRSLSGKNSSGDLISFIKENLSSFAEAAGSRNEIDAVNKILARMANITNNIDYKINTFIRENKNYEAKPFNEGRYEKIEDLNEKIKISAKFLNERKIDEDTAKLFINNFEIIKDTESKWQYYNIAFPYKIPGDNKCVGYEIRGFNKFKSKATGTDSTSGSWQAYVGDPEKQYIKQLHIAESAFDIMAFVQLNKNLLNLNECLFISMGGTFSEKQMKGIKDKYPHSKFSLHFDNDINGIIYDCRTYAILNNKELRCNSDGENVTFQYGELVFRIPQEKLSYDAFCKEYGKRDERINIWKAPLPNKDWNDVLLLNRENKINKFQEEENLINYKLGRSR